MFTERHNIKQEHSLHESQLTMNSWEKTDTRTSYQPTRIQVLYHQLFCSASEDGRNRSNFVLTSFRVLECCINM